VRYDISFFKYMMMEQKKEEREKKKEEQKSWKLREKYL